MYIVTSKTLIDVYKMIFDDELSDFSKQHLESLSQEICDLYQGEGLKVCVVNLQALIKSIRATREQTGVY